MDEQPALEVLDERGCGFRAVFWWHDDRYVHRIECLDRHRIVACLTSVDGDDQSPWPPSPPLQQINMTEHRPGQHAVLLLGMAGKSHWSMSVECDARPASLSFDVACRLQRSPEWLGSTYASDVPPELYDSRNAFLPIPDPASDVMIGALDGCLLQAGDPGIARRLTLVAATTPAGLPATFRWKYRTAYFPV